jgi:lipopolysaccharide biosynthesis glycosyltransferase
VNSNEIHVAMCVDHGFVVPLAVALASLDGVSQADAVKVHVLHPGIDAGTRQRVVSGLSAVDVSWVAMDDGAVHGAHYSDFLSSATLYRLLLGKLLPADIERVIYLDADTLVVNSLAAMYQADLDGNVIGAVRDAGSPWAAGNIGADWRKLGLKPSSNYFNAGVLLIDLTRWRQEEVGTRCLELLRQFRPRWGDQDALNTVLEGMWLELPRRWNLQTAELTGYSAGWALWRSEVEAAVADPAVIHYTGMDKPWHLATEHPRAEDWLRWVDLTAWSGWRPKPPKESHLEAMARSAVRSARKWRARRNPGGLPT